MVPISSQRRLDSSVEYPWNIDGISLEYHWNIIGISLEYHWNINEYHYINEYHWNIDDSYWITGGLLDLTGSESGSESGSELVRK